LKPAETIPRTTSGPDDYSGAIDEPLPRPRARRRLRAPDAALLALLVGASLVLRLEGQHTWFWIDEALSVGISSHRFLSIPHLLMRDGSPPLYFLLLHGWVRLFGTSEMATHVLSLIFSLATVPVAFWAGRRVFGRAAGWIAAVMAATTPYLTVYARETRMYSLLVFLGLLAALGFVEVFVHGRRRWIPLLVAALTLSIYTHNWALFVAAGAAAAVVPCWFVRHDRNRLVVEAVLVFGAVGLLYLPWLPTLWYQAHHTAAPWSVTPHPRDMISAVAAVSGDGHERVLVVLVLVAGAGLIAPLRRFPRLEAAPIVGLGVMLGAAVAAAWVASQLQPAWAYRYFGVFLAPLILLGAVGLARSGTRGLVGLALILAIWIQPLARLGGLHPPIRPSSKSADKAIVADLRPLLAPSDVVLSVQPERVPLLAYYFGREHPLRVRFATPLGFVADPTVMDWRDAPDHLASSTPENSLVPVLDTVPVGGRLALLCSEEPGHHEDVEWQRTINRRCTEWLAYLKADPALSSAPVPNVDKVRKGASAYTLVFTRVA
jgi:hypothetical protein